VESIEGGGDAAIEVACEFKIPRKLGGQELIMVERTIFDHPISVDPSGGELGRLRRQGVGVADGLEPNGGEVFREGVGLEKGIDFLLVARVLGEGKGAASESERESAMKDGRIGLRGGEESVSFKGGQNEAINLAGGPAACGDRRHGHLGG
jgi:hypothetical protein